MKRYKYFRRYIFRSGESERKRKIKILQIAEQKQCRIKIVTNYGLLYPPNPERPARVEEIKKDCVKIELSYEIFAEPKLRVIKEIHLFRKQ